MKPQNLTFIVTASILSFFLSTAEITAQNIYTIAGTGTSGFTGNGGPAISAALDLPLGVAVDASGNIFIADRSNHRVRKVNTSGIISTVAGTGATGSTGDGGQATAAKLFYPYGVAVDGSGNIFIADNSNHKIRKVDVSTGIISTVAGIGTGGSTGDGGAATAAQLSSPSGAAVDASGNLYIADMSNNKVRKVDALTGIISTIAGTGTSGFSGDGGAATAAQLYSPWSLSLDAAGNIFIADVYNHRIRKVNVSGIISTVVGAGTPGFSGDGGAATAAELNGPYGVVVEDISGNIFIADKDNNRVRKVDASGVISTVAGTGTAGYNGDGIAATSAQLKEPAGVAVSTSGCLFIADYLNHRIRQVVLGACSAPNSVEFLSSVGVLDILNIYPNPVSDNVLTVLIVTGKNISAQAEVLNTLGQVVYEKEISLQKGQTEIKIPVSQLAAGQYMFRVTLPNLESTHRIFVK